MVLAWEEVVSDGGAPGLAVWVGREFRDSVNPRRKVRSSFMLSVLTVEI